MRFMVIVNMPKSVLLQPRLIGRALENALSGAALDVKVDFEVTTQTWNERPAFKITQQPFLRRIETTDDVYNMLDAGTRKHDIEPKNGKALVFQANYKAKTQPRVIASSAGGPSGAKVFAMAVHHPGTKAREFSKTIGEKWQKQLPTILQRAIDAEVARGG